MAEKPGNTNSTSEAVTAPGGHGDPAPSCFVLLARFLGVPADTRQIGHDRGRGDEPYTIEDLSRTAKRLGLVSRQVLISIAAGNHAPEFVTPLPDLDGDGYVDLRVVQ